MKKLILTSIIFLFPFVANATTTIPWIASSTPSSFVQPTVVNGVIQALKITGTATSTINKLEVDQLKVNTGAVMPVNLSLTGFTQGSVLFCGVNCAITQNNSQFFWDNTNNRLGIGTILPSSKLHVAGQEADLLLLEDNRTSGSSSGAGFVAYSNDGSAMASGDRLGFNIFAGYDGVTRRNGAAINGLASGTWSSGVFPTDLAFETTQSGTRSEKLRITGAGNVGIGTTTSDRARLSLSGTDTGGYVGTIQLNNKNSSGANAFITASDANWTAGSNKLFFGIGGDPSSTNVKITIDGATSNFGIGTTSPQKRLHINDSTESTILITSNLTGSASTDGFFFGLNTNGLDTTLWNFENGYMRFATNNLERMRIDSSGNVGIGTTSPYTKLAVTGEVVANIFTATSTTATSTFAGGFNVNNGSLMYDYGGAYTNVDNLQTGQINFDSDAGVVTWADMPVSTSATNNTVESYTANLNGSPILSVYGLSTGTGLVKSTGVGIGTTSPMAKLAISMSTTTDMQYAFRISSTTASNVMTDLFTVTNAGRVGIGTASPSTLLTLVGGNTITFTGVSAQNQSMTLSTDGSDNGYLNFGGGSGKAFNIQSSGSTVATFNAASNGHTITGSMTFNVNSSNTGIVVAQSGGGYAARFSGGSVGIGTTTPAKLFSVHGQSLLGGNTVVGGNLTATGTVMGTNLMYAEVTVSSSQLQNLVGSPVTLIDAPGDGKVLEPIDVVVIYDYNSTPYTTPASVINFSINSVDFASASISTPMNEAFAGTSDVILEFPLTSASSYVLAANTALLLTNGGSELADGDSPIRLKITYRVHTTGL